MEWISFLANVNLPPESATDLNAILIIIKRVVALIGGLVIMSGSLFAIYQYVIRIFNLPVKERPLSLDVIRANLGRSIILGLEFIVAADIISTTTTPDYYAVGILAILVLIRTFLSYILNKEIDILAARDQDRVI